MSINNGNNNKEGRVITCEFDKYYLVNVYTVNAGQDLKRLDYRVEEWDVDFRNHILKLILEKMLRYIPLGTTLFFFLFF